MPYTHHVPWPLPPRSFSGGRLSSPDAAARPPPANESTSSAAAGDTVTVSHKFGETTIPADPKRVVTAGWIDQDFVLSLGVVPVGSRGGYFENYDSFPWVQQETGGKGVPRHRR